MKVEVRIIRVFHHVMEHFRRGILLYNIQLSYGADSKTFYLKLDFRHCEKIARSFLLVRQVKYENYTKFCQTTVYPSFSNEVEYTGIVDKYKDDIAKTLGCKFLQYCHPLYTCSYTELFIVV